MSRRRVFMVVTLVLLGALVVLDNVDTDWSQLRNRVVPDAPQQSTSREALSSLYRALNAREDVEQAYRNVAVRYATNVAELDTLMLEERDPRRVALDALNSRLREIPYLEAKRVSAGEPRDQGDGVSLVSLKLALESPTHAAAITAVFELSRPDRGYAWEEFDLNADAEAKRVRITGTVLAVVVEPAE